MHHRWHRIGVDLWRLIIERSTSLQKRFLRRINLFTKCTRGGGEDTTFEAKDSEKVWGEEPSSRGQFASRPRTERLEAKAKDTFENARKYKCKHCNYDFIGIQASNCINWVRLSLLISLFWPKVLLQVLATSYITSYYIVYYLLQYAVLNEYICGQWRSKGRDVEIYAPGRRRWGRINTLCSIVN